MVVSLCIVFILYCTSITGLYSTVHVKAMRVHSLVALEIVGLVPIRFLLYTSCVFPWFLAQECVIPKTFFCSWADFIWGANKIYTWDYSKECCLPERTYFTRPMSIFPLFQLLLYVLLNAIMHIFLQEETDQWLHLIAWFTQWNISYSVNC